MWTRTADIQFAGILQFWVGKNKSNSYSKKLISLVSDRTDQIAKKPFLYKSADFNDTRVASMGHFSIYYKLALIRMENEETTYSIDFYDVNSNQTSIQKLVVTEGRNPSNRNVVWNCDFNFNGKTISVKDEYCLSGVMNRIREEIEPSGYRALVVCSDLDAHHSGMQADMTNGTMIYKLTQKDENGKFKSYPVFKKSSIDKVGTLEEQKSFYLEYLETLSHKKQESLPWYKKIFK